MIQKHDSKTTELSSNQTSANAADLHMTIEHLKQVNKSQEDIIIKMRRENVEKDTLSNSK